MGQVIVESGPGPLHASNCFGAFQLFVLVLVSIHLDLDLLCLIRSGMAVLIA